MLNPWEYSIYLQENRLKKVAKILVDGRNSALDSTSTPYDDSYTQGCVTFGRQRNMLKEFGKETDTDWFQVVHGGMDLVFKIGDIVCRFFVDISDDDPSKPAVFIPTEGEEFILLGGQCELDFGDDSSETILWRFIMERLLTDESADQDSMDVVHFVGYNRSNQIVSKWTFKQSITLLHSTDDDQAHSKKLERAKVLPRDSLRKDKVHDDV